MTVKTSVSENNYGGPMDYPYLARLRDPKGGVSAENLVVLFTSPTLGTVVNRGLGYSLCFQGKFNEDGFRPLAKGSVVGLTQE